MKNYRHRAELSFLSVPNSPLLTFNSSLLQDILSHRPNPVGIYKGAGGQATVYHTCASGRKPGCVMAGK